MKFIKNGVIYTTNNEFVIGQMKKSGYEEYNEITKEKEVKTPIEEIKEDTKEEKPKKRKK